MQFEISEPPPPTVALKYLIHERPILHPLVHILKPYNNGIVQKRSDYPLFLQLEPKP